MLTYNLTESRIWVNKEREDTKMTEQRIEYRAYVKRGYGCYDWQLEYRAIHQWNTDLNEVKKDLKRELAEWDGKPKRTVHEVRSAKTAKEMMVTDWKIKSRVVTKKPDYQEGHRELPDYQGIEDPKEDYMYI